MYATILREFAVLLFFILKYSDAFAEKTCKVPNADGGICTTLDKCDPLYQLNKKMPKTPEEDTFFRQSVGSCNSRGSKIKVCCPSKSQWDKLVIRPVNYPHTNHLLHNAIDGEPVRDPVPVTERISNPVPVVLTANIPTPSDAEKMTDWLNRFMLQPVTDKCGSDSSSAQRIVGGNATEIDEFPWLALLEYEPKKFKCGGSLISKSHVLTAAHCLYTPPSQVRLSEYNLTTEPTDIVETNGGGFDDITVTIVKISWTRQHPEHIYGSSVNDIGLIKMVNEVEYGDFIKPICLPAKDYRNTYFTVTTNFTVAGWGSDNKYINSEVKRSVSLPYVPTDVCLDSYGNLRPDQVVCAGGEMGKDSCRGDSGGPLMYEDSSGDNNFFVLVGVVSSGYEECGAKDRPGVYTYVFNYVDWIKKMMSNNGQE